MLDQLLLLPRADHRGGYGKEVAGLHRRQGRRSLAVEGVELHPGGALFEQHGDDMAAGRARVDVERQTQLLRKTDEAFEDFALQFPVRFFLTAQ